MVPCLDDVPLHFSVASKLQWESVFGPADISPFKFGQFLSRQRVSSSYTVCARYTVYITGVCVSHPVHLSFFL